jgi:hypothetical protein
VSSRARETRTDIIADRRGRLPQVGRVRRRARESRQAPRARDRMPQCMRLPVALGVGRSAPFPPSPAVSRPETPSHPGEMSVPVEKRMERVGNTARPFTASQPPSRQLLGDEPGSNRASPSISRCPRCHQMSPFLSFLARGAVRRRPDLRRIAETECTYRCNGSHMATSRMPAGYFGVSHVSPIGFARDVITSYAPIGTPCPEISSAGGLAHKSLPRPARWPNSFP